MSNGPCSSSNGPNTTNRIEDKSQLKIGKSTDGQLDNILKINLTPLENHKLGKKYFPYLHRHYQPVVCRAPSIHVQCISG